MNKKCMELPVEHVDNVEKAGKTIKDFLEGDTPAEVAKEYNKLVSNCLIEGVENKNMKKVDFDKIRNNLNDKLFYYSHGRKRNVLETLDSAIDDLSDSTSKESKEVTADEVATYTKELGYCLRRKSVADLVEFTKNNAHVLGEEVVASFVQSSPKVQEMTMWKLIYHRKDLKDMHKEAKDNIEGLESSKTL